MRLKESNVTTESYELQQPEHIVSLATSSMLVSVDVSIWTATKQDRGISEEVTTMKNAESGTGKFTKNLFAKNPKHKNKHHRIVKLQQLINKWAKESTYSWNKTQNLLPTVDLEKFKAEYEKYIAVSFLYLVVALLDTKYFPVHLLPFLLLGTLPGINHFII